MPDLPPSSDMPTDAGDGAYDDDAIDRGRRAVAEMPAAIGRYRILEYLGGGGGMGEVYVGTPHWPSSATARRHAC